jgi:AAA ATPase domain
VLAGSCLPTGDGSLPYAPIVEALRPLPSELGVGAVRGLIGSSWSELARLLPVLGEPPSGPAGQAARARLFELLLGLLGRLGEQAPVLLVVEDLHWADRSTHQLLLAGIETVEAAAPDELAGLRPRQRPQMQSVQALVGLVGQRERVTRSDQRSNACGLRAASGERQEAGTARKLSGLRKKEMSGATRPFYDAGQWGRGLGLRR